MYGDMMVLLGAVMILASVCGSAFVIRRVRRQIAEMTEALEDVKNGNGNRRILSETHELTAPLAYVINDIILSYENRLSACHRTEETNRQLMTSLSHDVRTPLTTLIGYLDAAHKGIVAGKEREDYIETARRKAYDLKEYIDVLFDWFRLGSDEFTMNIITVDLTELTRNLFIDWIPVFEDAQMEFAADIPERRFRVKLDPDGYRRILNNLVQNVISHSHGSRIEIALLEQGGTIKIRLADNGVGIEKERLRQIRESLQSAEEQGHHIGMRNTHKRLVLTYPGNAGLTVVSHEGRGTCVRFEVPKEGGNKDGIPLRM